MSLARTSKVLRHRLLFEDKQQQQQQQQQNVFGPIRPCDKVIEKKRLKLNF